MLLDLVAQRRQGLVQGLGFPLGLLSGASPRVGAEGGGGGRRGVKQSKRHFFVNVNAMPTFCASPPVTATMRRTPLAMASSETMTNGAA